MYTKSETFYDAIYGTIKNYEREAQQLHALIQRYKQSPGNTLLDVACGTGMHISFMRQRYTVEGLDLDEQMLTIARRRNPGIAFHHADMADFNLGRQFDVITCLFSAIGFVKTLPRLHQTLQTMRHHLHSRGVVLLEPWLAPEQYEIGHLSATFVNQPDLKIARMSKGEADAGISIVNTHYLVATPVGIEYFTELFELGLFSHEDYLDAFRASGLNVTHDPDPEQLTGRGLYIGVAP